MQKPLLTPPTVKLTRQRGGFYYPQYLKTRSKYVQKGGVYYRRRRRGQRGGLFPLAALGGVLAKGVLGSLAGGLASKLLKKIF